ncbi:hypothetical protein PF007_g30635, partial [Phytophthora fragariae]
TTCWASAKQYRNRATDRLRSLDSKLCAERKLELLREPNYN